MTITNRLGRPMIAAMFICGGADQLRNPESKASTAASVTDELHERFDDLPLPDDPVDLVRINGAVQVAAGTLLAINRLPRLASLALAGSLVPTTLAGHAFWEIEDEQQRKVQRIHFMRNLAMFGGLLIAAGDTGRRPSAGWKAKKAVTDAGDAVSDARGEVASSARRFRRSGADLADTATSRVSDTVSGVSGAVAGVGSTSTPAFHDAGQAAADAVSHAYDRAQPALEAASTKTRTRARDLWAAAVPAARSLRAQSKDLAEAAAELASQAGSTAADATRKRTAAVRAAVG